jgi:hypothetical protein
MESDDRRILAARVIAVAADAVQLGIMPLFVEGALSPVNDALDVVVAALMVWLVGWHWAFVPAFLSELIPTFDLVPTWTAAVLLATRRGAVQPPRPVQPATPRTVGTGPAAPPVLPPKGE